ncbi:MAG: YlxR family protein [Coprococcus sp.]|nr:YlxR family protein [Coprococcus sp.]
MAKKIPLRQCLGCHEARDKRELIRVVKDNENHFAIDATGKMNGRGAYICKKKECLEKAIRSKSLEKSFKMSIPAEVYEKLNKELEDIGK